MAKSDDDKDRDEGEQSDAASDEKAQGNEGEGEESGSGDEGASDASEESSKVETAASRATTAKAAASAAIAKQAKAVAPKPPPSAGLGKSVMLFILVVGGLSLLMLVLGNEKGASGPQAPKWADGQTVDVEITLVSTDKNDLACASGTEIKGLHCGFESQTKRWSKGDANDDKKTLKPYSTTGNVNFMAAGVWSDPALAGDKLPQTRFSVKCKLTVAGKMPRADVRWHEGEGWNGVSDWYAGSVADCKLGTVQQ